MTSLRKIFVTGAMATSLFATLFAFTAPTLPVFAQATGVDDPKDANFQLVPCSGVDKVTGAETCTFKDLFTLANRIIKFLLYFSIPLVLGVIMYTAFKYLTANGDPGKLADAKKMLVPVALGLFWILAAYLIVYTFLDKVLDDSAGSATKGILKEYFKN